MLTDIKPRTIDEVKKEYWRAVVALDVAYNHFENAEPGFVDTAIAELAAASMKVVAIRNLLKRSVK